MANEVNMHYVTGQTLTFGVYTLAGTQREVGTAMTETPASSGLYLGSPTTIVTGDNVVVKDGTTVIGGGQYNPNVLLASDGLDNISTAEPSGLASNFREMLVQVFRRLFGKATMTSSTLLCYKEDETTVATTQVISDDGTTQTQGEAS